MNRHTDSAIGILERLVGFDTTSRDSNMPLIDWVAAYLEEHGVASIKVMDADGGKANLVATIGEQVDGGIVLSGHTDVVPVDGQDWQTAPFTLTRKGDQLFGRGSSDMKGFIACALAAVPDLVAAKLTRPVHLAFSYDEEVGCFGVHGIVDLFEAEGFKPAICLVGEPTMMRVVNAHKGAATFITRLKGKEVHSSLTHMGVNTVIYGAELVGFIAKLAEERKQQVDPNFDPPYTTVHVGMMHGGTAVNIVPQDCEIVWEFRAVEGDDGSDIKQRVQEFIDTDLLPRMRAVAPGADIVTEPIAEVVGLFPEKDGPAETLIKLLAQRNDTETVSYGTEGGVFQVAGISTVVCGPGDIAVAHQPNEFVDVDQISQCMDLMDRLRTHISA
ncbi:MULTISPECIES: acetylornithine deacetylase [unclassified Minwuia]|jgi:acetylornithine deacetylase|uniref:acetylornithine deacetylase n=1 Tax=unclassified Minwuia TaxID=2618799 RepID=UPI00247A54E8|nr:MULTISPECIES: acetylornithine deacetylase [unclassified Minwuia]